MAHEGYPGIEGQEPRHRVAGAEPVQVQVSPGHGGELRRQTEPQAQAGVLSGEVEAARKELAHSGFCAVLRGRQEEQAQEASEREERLPIQLAPVEPAELVLQVLCRCTAPRPPCPGPCPRRESPAREP